MLIKLAWRNLWRNKRRSFITLASVFFAVILSTLMMSIKEGTYVKMIDSMVASYTGYVQIHTKGYWDEKILDNSFEINRSMIDVLNNTKDVVGYLPRLESFALSASREYTKGALVMGIDPEKEKKQNHLDKRVFKGKYFSSGDNTALIGDGLAKYLKIDIGDTIVLIGQGYHGASAAGKYMVGGIVKVGSPDLSKQVVYLTLNEAQYLYSMENRYTAITLTLSDLNKADRICKEISDKIGDDYEVMDWEALAPELKDMIEADKVEGYVFMFILYMVVSFGILGTALMMLAERKHEFGVLVAIGMKRLRLALIVLIETVMISVLGAFMGMLGAFPVCLYFHLSPIRFGEGEMAKMYEEYGMEAVLQASIDPGVFFQQAFVIAIIACFISIYPFISVNRLNAIEAMRS